MVAKKYNPNPQTQTRNKPYCKPAKGGSKKLPVAGRGFKALAQAPIGTDLEANSKMCRSEDSDGFTSACLGRRSPDSTPTTGQLTR